MPLCTSTVFSKTNDIKTLDEFHLEELILD
jgi:hypothetical protein